MDDFGILSLLPPVLAIVLALITRDVIPSLFAGIWIGATMLEGWNPFAGLYTSFSNIIAPSLGDPDNATIILYAAFFGGLIAVLQKTGGAYAIAEAVAKRVKSPMGAQFATWLFGLAIFFEDYFNALTVGSVMRPVTDKFRVSREKLAYIVDSTSAPACLLGPISTWVVFVMGLIGTEFAALHIADTEYIAYLKTIPYNFYAILALVMVLFVISSKFEFGPMATAERRARTEGKLMRDGANPPSASEITDARPLENAVPKLRNIVIPIAVLLILIPIMYLWSGGYMWTGGAPSKDLFTAIADADGGLAITLAALIAGAVGIVLGMSQKIFNFRQGIDIYMSGIKGMTLVYVILTLAWSIGAVTKEIGTAKYVISIVQGTTWPEFIPVLLFVIGAIIAFTTGTSYGTFAIMLPIAIPLAHQLDVSVYAAIAAVFSGGIFGDHCSPISDTTILSSSGASCDHIDHVNTQLPYALTAGIGGIAAFLVLGFTDSILLSLAAGTIVLLAISFALNKVWGTDKVKPGNMTA